MLLIIAADKVACTQGTAGCTALTIRVDDGEDWGDEEDHKAHVPADHPKTCL